MPIVPIVLGVLIIAGIVAVVLSRFSWRWHNITLVTFIILLTPVWFYLAARTLKLQDNWRKEIAQYEKEITPLVKENEKLRNGERGEDGGTPSLIARKVELEKMLAGRGRMWVQVVKKSVAPTGVITAVVEKPDPHGIAPNTIVWVFDDVDAQQGGQFLGQFEASAVNGTQVTLTPVLPVMPADIQRFNQKRGAPLVMYEIMPADSHEAFADLEEAARAAMLPAGVPADVKQEYLKDGQPPAADEKRADRIWRRVKALKDFDVTHGQGPTEEKQRIAQGTELKLDPETADKRIAAGDVEPLAENDKVYVRPLRDYAQLYRDLSLGIRRLQRANAEAAAQLDVVENAQKKVDADLAYRTEEQQKLKSDLAHFIAERDLIAKHVAALEKEIAKVDAERRKAFAENAEMEAEISQLNHEAADAINRRTDAAGKAASKAASPQQ
jgi:hypothetical protein